MASTLPTWQSIGQPHLERYIPVQYSNDFLNRIQQQQQQEYKNAAEAAQTEWTQNFKAAVQAADEQNKAAVLAETIRGHDLTHEAAMAQVALERAKQAEDLRKTYLQEKANKLKIQLAKSENAAPGLGAGLVVDNLSAEDLNNPYAADVLGDIYKKAPSTTIPEGFNSKDLTIPTLATIQLATEEGKKYMDKLTAGYDPVKFNDLSKGDAEGYWRTLAEKFKLNYPDLKDALNKFKEKAKTITLSDGSKLNTFEINIMADEAFRNPGWFKTLFAVPFWGEGPFRVWEGELKALGERAHKYAGAFRTRQRIENTIKSLEGYAGQAEKTEQNYKLTRQFIMQNATSPEQREKYLRMNNFNTSTAYAHPVTRLISQLSNDITNNRASFQ